MSFLASLFLSGGLLAFKPNLGFENSNIASYNRTTQWGDYNRLRADLTLEHQSISSLILRCQVDNETRYQEHPASLTNKSSVYRAYLQYSGEKHFISIGRQRVPFGVGRIWNPIDQFNPINAQAIESGERVGTEAIRYEYAISQLSDIDITVSANKQAARIKGFLEYADLALVGVYDNDQDLDIIGWEAEGELFTSGIELRSEGGRFHNRINGNNHVEFIIGAEYGFASSLTLLTEYQYNDQTKIDHLGLTASYQFDPLWTAQMISIINLDDCSHFTAPSIEHSLSDEMTISAGVNLYHGNNPDEFGQKADLYYLRWFVHF